MVAAGFSLLSVSTKDGSDFNDIEAVTGELDASPPSLYLFRAGREPWTTDVDFIPWIDLANSAKHEPNLFGYLRTWWDASEHSFQRSLFICGRTRA